MSMWTTQRQKAPWRRSPSGWLSKEVAREGIHINCVRPGHIYTEMHACGGEPGRVDRVKDSIPMGRGGEPEEVARAVLWLAGAEASFITWTFLDVTGASDLFTHAWCGRHIASSSTRTWHKSG